MTSSTELWLLANRQGVSLVSALGLTIVSESQACPPNDSPHLESILPELADALVEAIDGSALAVVHLHVSLPVEWQFVPWESLTLGGRRLFGKVVYCRHANYGNGKLTNLGSTLHVHSLWPDTSLVAGILRPAIAAGKVRLRPARLDWPLQRQTWRDVWALAIIGHGSDSPDVTALDETGAPWTFPPLPHWPDVIFLLACGADSSLIRHAESLLAAGAPAVVVGEGILDLQASLEGLANLESRIAAGGNLTSAIASLQQNDKRPGGVRHWVICGQPPGADAHSRLDHWTLRSLAEKGNLSKAPEAWREFHDIEHGARGEGELLDELKNTRCWPITASWVLPQAMALAEIYDPAAQAGLSRQYASLPDELIILTPHQSDHALAQSLRRQGKFLAAMRALMHAFEEVRETSVDAENRLRYLLTLFDLLLDLHLPKAAGAVREQIRSLMLVGDDLDFCVLEHHWQDRESIWFWRGGQPELAYATQLRKRDKALDMGEDGYRELARLLWMAGWRKQADAPELLSEAESILGAEQLATLGSPGNDDFKYLFRSCTLARWRLGLSENIPTELRSKLIDSLSDASLDPGPSATSILISALHTGSHSWPLQLALLRLDEAGYWLESGYWGSLHGQQTHVAQTLERLFVVRNQAESMLRKHGATLCAWMESVDTWLDAMRLECEERNIHEQKGLTLGTEPWKKGLML